MITRIGRDIPRISSLGSTAESRRPVEAPRSWTSKVEEKPGRRGSRGEWHERRKMRGKQRERESEVEVLSLPSSLRMDDNCVLHSLVLYDRSRMIQPMQRWRRRYSHILRLARREVSSPPTGIRFLGNA